MNNKKVLIVLTNQKLFNKESQFSIYLNEVVEFYDEITKLGYECVFCNLNKSNSNHDKFNLINISKQKTKLFYRQETDKKILNSTKHLKEINPYEFSAIFLPGGYEVFNDYYNNLLLNKFLLKLYENNAYICTCSRGLIALLKLKNKDGKHLLYQRKITATSNEEEKLNFMIDKIPFLLENKLKSIKAKYIKHLPYYEHVIQDKQLITAQNEYSSRKLANILHQNLIIKP